MIGCPSGGQVGIAETMAVDLRLIETVRRYIGGGGDDLFAGSEFFPEQWAWTKDRILVGGPDPYRFPIRLIEEARLPPGLSAPGREMAKIIPDPYLPVISTPRPEGRAGIGHL